ncbi:MAG: hypothetical protein JRI31_10865 [Deltaproteobacteria bacterium]|nr:hypothetical protein [Deltaproteobacteria bacterium]
MRRDNVLIIWVGVVVWAIAFFLITVKSFYRFFDHDENLYVAGAYLISKGYLPYFDFRYTHWPLQPLIMAPLMKIFSHKLLVFRVTNSMFAAASIFLIFCAAYIESAKREAGRKVGIVIGIIMALCVLCNPVFIYTSGVAWNHDLATFLALLSLMFLLWNTEPTNIFLAALFLGLASCTRLNFILGFPLLFLWVIFHKLPWKSFILGSLVGGLPAMFFFFLNPKIFYANTVTSQKAHLAYLHAIGNSEVTTLDYKLIFLKKVFLASSSSTLIIGIVFCLLSATKIKDKAIQISVALSFMQIFFPFLTATVYLQYLYAPLMLMALTSAITLVKIYSDFRHRHLGKIFIACLAVYAVFTSLTYANAYVGTLKLASQEKLTVPHMIHRIALDFDQASPPGRFLTLWPIFATEAERELYLGLADGPFTWRDSLTLENPREFSLPEFKAILEGIIRERPAAIVLGCETKRIEKKLFDLAHELNFSLKLTRYRFLLFTPN